MICHVCGKEFEMDPDATPLPRGACFVFVCSEECGEALDDRKPYTPPPGGFGRMTERERDIARGLCWPHP